MIPSTVRAVIFDAVGTLLHPEPAAPTLYASIGSRFGSRRTVADIRARFRDAFRREEARDGKDQLRTSEEREVERWRHIVAEVLDDVNDVEACFGELFTHFSLPAAWRCDADAADTLGELTRRGYVLGIASNYDRRLRNIVVGLPQLGPVSHLFISSEIGWRKPAAEFFRELCQRVGLAPAEVLLVGDDLANDILGARAAGLPAILFDPQDRQTAETPRITSLSELLGRARA